LGAGVTNFKVGQRVYYHGNIKKTYGTLAEYGSINAKTVSHLPDNVTFEQAASLPTAGWTAWSALHDKGRVRSGETILITAASGGSKLLKKLCNHSSQVLEVLQFNLQNLQVYKSLQLAVQRILNSSRNWEQII